MEAEPEAPSLKDDLGRVGDAAKWLLLGIAVLTLPLPAVLEKLTDNEAVDVWRIVAKTGPLSLGVAAIVAIAVSSKIPAHVQFLIATAILSSTTLLGVWVGALGAEAVSVFDGVTKWQDVIPTLLMFYARVYSGTEFLSAVVVGGFLGGTWWYLVPRRIALASVPRPR